MKTLFWFLSLLVLLFGSYSRIWAQVIPEEFTIIMRPIEEQNLQSNNVFFFIKENELQMDFNVSAHAIQHNDSIDVYLVILNIALKTKLFKIPVFIDSIGLSLNKNQLNYPLKTGVQYYSLPSDTTSLFLVNSPYKATLFYRHFNYEIKNDTLSLILHMPPIYSNQRDLILKERVIKLYGIIPNY